MSSSQGTTRSSGAVGHGVHVSWHHASDDADQALREQVALVTGTEQGSVEVGRLCARCGRDEHGRPWASHGVHVSLARSGPHLVTAVSTSGPVGIDVESVMAVDGAWADLTALLDPGLVPAGDGRAAWWCRLEAALKRDGVGLSGQIDLTRLDRGFVDDVEAPPGYCAAIAVGGP